jgi:hypothetical protein
MATKLNENNDQFYGKVRKPSKTKGNPGNVDLEFESINPYEFKKGMDYELNKMGVLTLREVTEEDREKATETIIKNLKDVPAYYSYMIHYETVTRNMDRKPSFKTFVKEIGEYSMKEVNEKFNEDKMKEIKLKESVRAEVRKLIRETFLREQEEADMDMDAPTDGSGEKTMPDVQRMLNYISKIDRKQEFLQLFTALMKHRANVKPEIQPALLLKLFRELNS